MGAEVSTFAVNDNEEKKKDNMDADDEDMQEVCVSGTDKRLPVYKTKHKTDAIVQCIGQLRITYDDVKGGYVIGTGTIFHVAQNKCFVLTCAHNIRATIYQCTNEQCNNKYLIKTTCKVCGSNVEKRKELHKAAEVTFIRWGITEERFGKHEEEFDCDIDGSFINDKEYSKYPYVKSGYDIAILVINDQKAAEYYRTKCSKIFLVNNFDLFLNDQHQMSLFGYPGDKSGEQMWGMSTKNGFQHGFNAYTLRLYLINKQIDTQKGQSGAIIYCLGEKANTFWICSIHTGGSQRACQNYGTLLHKDTLKWIQLCFESININIENKIIEKDVTDTRSIPYIYERVHSKINDLSRQILQKDNELIVVTEKLIAQQKLSNEYSFELSTQAIEIETLQEENDKLQRQNNELTLNDKLVHSECKENAEECGWDGNKKGSNILISGRNIKHNGWFDGWCSVYGKAKCTAPMKYHWELFIEHISNNRIMVGIASVNSRYLDVATTQKETYAFYSRPEFSCIQSEGLYTKKRYARKLSSSDIIEVVLDLENNTLSFKINKKDYGVAVNAIPNSVDYCLVVSMYHKGTKLILLS